MKQDKLETKVKEMSLLELKRKVGPPVINFRKKKIRGYNAKENKRSVRPL